MRVKKAVFTCPMCDKKRMMLPCHIKNRKACSRKCYYIWKIGKHPLYVVRIMKICLICKKKFYINPNSNQKLCSRKCSDRHVGDALKLKPKKRVNVICIMCKYVMELLPSRVNKNDHKRMFCSHSCKATYDSIYNVNRRTCDNGWFYSLKARQAIHYRSSWEAVFIEDLEVDVDIKNFSNCLFSIPYKHKNKTKMYIPDFYVEHKSGACEIVEIKPSNEVGSNINKLKFKAAKGYAFKNKLRFNVLTEVDLKI